MRALLPCLVTAGLLAGCSGEPPDPDSYFPLEPGLRWTYRVTTTVAGASRESRFSEHNAPPENVKGLEHAVRVTSDGTRYYLLETGEGVLRAAKRTLVESTPRFDEPPRWVLKRPLTPGSTWDHETHPYVLRRLHPYEESLTGSLRFRMAYEITAVDETVEVPAGRFEHCLRVDGDARLTLYADGRTGYQDIEIDTAEWYAPGVGLVKLVREEPLAGEVFAGGRVVFELERFEY